MEDEKKEVQSKQPMNDDELEQVVGGETILDRKGRNIGYTRFVYADFWRTTKVYFFSFRACSKCHHPMHQGTMGMWYCDPCDRWELNPDTRYIEGSKFEVYSYIRQFQ